MFFVPFYVIPEVTMNKILVIEDDSDLLEGLLFMLETEGPLSEEWNL